MERYNKMESQQEIKRDENKEMGIQKEIFSFLNLKYQQQNIPINNQESIYTIFVPAQTNKPNCENYYIGHGFGGSSLMYFPFLQALLKSGNVIFWEIRGMGLGKKLEQYNEQGVEQIETFFLKSVEVLFSHYRHSNCTFVAHSLSSYLVLLYCVRYPQIAKKHVKRLLLFSPIGITTKQQDYKNSIHSCSDALYTIFNKFCWNFNLTYKSLLRTICCCCKKSLVMNGMKDVQMSEREKDLICQIVQTLVLLLDGSQKLFFDYFEPRVIPKVAIEPLLKDAPQMDIILVYGGEEDWVDKGGAKKISQRFPQSIRYVQIAECGHNIPFDINVCNKLFTQYL